jgi:hypothetical protein
LATGYRGFGLHSPIYNKCVDKSLPKNSHYHQSHPHHTIYPIRGGGNYRGIYDVGLKGAFMGYRGLLLNDPYKRDRIDGCMLDIFLFFFFLLVILSPRRG